MNFGSALMCFCVAGHRTVGQFFKKNSFAYFYCQIKIARSPNPKFEKGFFQVRIGLFEFDHYD
jgi:hypothetical protein